jgi:putative hemolysin
MKIKFVIPLFIIILLTPCNAATGEPRAEPNVGLANPASVNCTEQGGTSRIETRLDGGQFGVCDFEDNRQCEEFALLRGDCPMGGVRVTGYVTDAGRYCAITGGAYAATGTDADGVETGSCTLADETVCEAQAFYEGTCPSSE